MKGKQAAIALVLVAFMLIMIAQAAPVSAAYKEYSFMVYNKTNVTGQAAYSSLNAGAKFPASGPAVLNEVVFTGTLYQGINASDTTRATSTNATASYKTHRFLFNLTQGGYIKQLDLSWQGYANGSTAANRTVNISAWNFTSSSWTPSLADGTGSADQWLSASKTTGIYDLINASNNVFTFIVETPNTQANTALFTNYVNMTVLYFLPPSINSISDSPDPVNQSKNVTINANVTDPVGVSSAWVNINGTNYTMANLTSIGNASNSTTQVPVSCVDSVVASADYEYYSMWTIPGSGNVTLTALMFHQNDTTLSSSELLTMALYRDGGAYERLTEVVTINGTGAVGWTGKALQKPIIIELNKTYWVGISTNGVAVTYNMARDEAANCANYLPNVVTRYISGDDNILDIFVPTSGYTNSSNHLVIPGINYTQSVTRWNYTYNTSSVIGLQNYTVYANNTIAYEATPSTGNFTVVDGIAPSFSNNQSQPVTTYSPSAYSNFSVTWSEANFYNAYLENNFTGSLKNTSMSGSYPNFYYNTTPLAAGTYQYRFVANDTSGNSNGTAVLSFTISQNATNPIDMYMTNSSGTYNNQNVTTEFGGSVTVNGTMVYTNSGTALLWRNGSSISNPNTTTPAIGDYVYKTNTSGNTNYTANNTGATYYLFIRDTTKPTITLTHPLNISYNRTWVWVNSTVSEAASWCGASINSTANQTMTNSSGNWNLNATSLAQGANNAKVFCNDTTGNMNVSATQYFTVDTVYPQVTIIYPDNITYDENISLPLNYTLTELNPYNCWYKLDGGTSTNLPGCGNTTFDAGPDGPHNVTVYANDTAGNTNSTTRYFRTNISEIFINVQSPTSHAYTTNQIWFNVSLFYAGSWCGYSLDSNPNVTMSNDTATHYYNQSTVSEGSHSVIFYCNDTIGSMDLSNVISFTVDTIKPTITLTSPDNTTYNTGWVWINATNSENDGWCGASINSTANQTMDNSSGNWNLNATVSQGANNAKVFCNDSSGNMNVSDTKYFYVDSIAPQWSLNQSSYPLAYNPATLSTFNITWAESTAISTVLFESNFSGGPQTYAMTNATYGGSIYTYSVILPAGTFYWKSYANDSLNNSNTSDTWYFTVGKGANPLILTITPATTVVYPNTTTAVCSASVGTPTLYRNDSGLTNQTNETILLGASVYNYSCNISATANYSGNSTYKTLTVNKNTSTANFMNLTINGTESNKIYTYPAVSNATAWNSIPELIFTFYRNGTSIGTGTASDVDQKAIGLYMYTYNTSDNGNYSAASKQFNLTINKGGSVCYLTVTPPTPISYNTPSTASCTCTNPEGSAALYRNISGTPTDVTLTENNVEITLPAGAWNYTCNVSSTPNYNSSTNSTVYNVAKADNPVTLYLNGTPNLNRTYTYPEAVNATGTATVGTVYVYRGGVQKATGPLSASEEILLGNGTYAYKVNATSGDANYSDNTTGVTFYALVNKGTTTTTLYLDGVDNSKSYLRYGNANFTVVLDVAGKKVFLDTNISGWSPINSTTPLINITNMSTLGVYNITGYFPGDGNYSASSQTWYATATSKNLSTCYLTVSPPSPTFGTAATAICGCDNPEATGSLYRNGTNVTEAENNTPVTLGAGPWNYICNVTETANYSSASDISTYTVSKASNPVNIYINNNMNQHVEVMYGPQSNVTGTATVGTANIYMGGTDVGNPYLETLGVGNYSFKVNATSGNSNYSNNSTGLTYTFNITKAPTEARLYLDGNRANANYAQYAIANFTVTTNISGLDVELWTNYSDGVDKLLNGPTTEPIVELTNLTDTGTFSWTAKFNGNSNYSASTETWLTGVASDAIAPTITIISPTAATYGSTSVPLTWVATDPSGVSWCGYSLNGAANTTVTTNTTLIATVGGNTLSMYCNDTLGNMGSSTVSFTVSTGQIGGGGGGITPPPTGGANFTFPIITPTAPAQFSPTVAGIAEFEVWTTGEVSNAYISVKEISCPEINTTRPVYRCFNVETNINDNIVNRTEIEYCVNDSWIATHDVKTTILARLTAGGWQSLLTTYERRESGETCFLAESPGMSYFAILGLTIPQVCTPYAKQCGENAVQKCNVEGTGWVDIETCEYGCDTKNLTCNPKTECIEGQIRCADNIAQICINKQWTQKELCSQDCKVGVCQKKLTTYKMDWEGIWGKIAGLYKWSLETQAQACRQKMIWTSGLLKWTWEGGWMLIAIAIIIAAIWRLTWRIRMKYRIKQKIRIKRMKVKVER